MAACLLAGASGAQSDLLSRESVRIFRETQACPLTGLTHDACPGWAITLKRPRCSGGTDDPANLQWLPKAVADVKEEIERQQCPVSVSDSSVPFFEAAR